MPRFSPRIRRALAALLLAPLALLAVSAGPAGREGPEPRPGPSWGHQETLAGPPAVWPAPGSSPFRPLDGLETTLRALASFPAPAEAAPPAARASSPGGSVWDAVAGCESGGDWGYNGPSGYDGGLQFDPGTWAAMKPADYPTFAWQASRAQQIAVAVRVLAAQGWGAWPACSRVLGLR